MLRTLFGKLPNVDWYICNAHVYVLKAEMVFMTLSGTTLPQNRAVGTTPADCMPDRQPARMLQGRSTLLLKQEHQQ